MHIISGQYKGRTIKMPKGIRPTQDKVRKALFDILGDIAGLSFLELFAGSGSIGFEAVSRGVRDLTLVEDNPECILAIRKNIDSLRLKLCRLFFLEVAKAIRVFHQERRKFEIIFLDPPYNQDAARKTLLNLSTYDILAPNGFIVIQHFKKDDLPDKLGVLNLFRQSRYGDTILSFYKKYCQ